MFLLILERVKVEKKEKSDTTSQSTYDSSHFRLIIHSNLKLQIFNLLKLKNFFSHFCFSTNFFFLYHRRGEGVHGKVWKPEFHDQKKVVTESILLSGSYVQESEKTQCLWNRRVSKKLLPWRSGLLYGLSGKVIHQSKSVQIIHKLSLVNPSTNFLSCVFYYLLTSKVK